MNKFLLIQGKTLGAKTAVCKFDMLRKTTLDLVLTKCVIPKFLVQRQLDDVPVVVPYKKLSWCE